MIVFLTHQEKAASKEMFAQDQDLLMQLVQPVTTIYTRNIDLNTAQNAQQLSYVKYLAQEVLVMFHSVFKQRLLEVLLECLGENKQLEQEASESSTYSKFCDRVEKEMNPYVESKKDAANIGFDDQALPYVQDVFIELKLPYMSTIEEQIERDEKERQQSRQQKIP